MAWLGARRFLRHVLAAMRVGKAGHGKHETCEHARTKLAPAGDVERTAHGLLVITGGESARPHSGAHMLSGADTPSSASPLRTTCCAPVTSVRRAARRRASSTMNRSAL